MLDHDEVARRIAVLEKHNGNKSAAALELGIARSSLNESIAKYAQTGKVIPGFEVGHVTTTFDKDGAVDLTSIRQRPEHTDGKVVPEGHVVKGLSTLLDPDGKIVLQWVKTKEGDVDVVGAFKEAVEELRGQSVPGLQTAPTEPRAHIADQLTVYPIADLHLGMLSWGAETGEDYDTKIAYNRLLDTMGQLVKQSRTTDTALLLNLGDWQHTDDQKNMTPGHGNILDVDTRYYRLLKTSIKLMIETIYLMLQKHGKVIVRNIPGNHDPHASIALSLAIDAYFSNEPRVQVITDPSDFFYMRWGACLIGATHGHKIKPADMAMHMAGTQAKDWGETLYRFFYFGHIHHESAKQVMGVKVESFETISAKDAFSASHGYQSGQTLTAITLDKETGQAGRHYVNVPPPETRRHPRWDQEANK